MRWISFLAAALVLQSPAGAETLKGEVTTLNPDMNAFSLRRLDSWADPASPDERVLVDNRTLYYGAAKLSDLAYGELVTVEGEEDPETGNWLAARITVAGADETAPPGAFVAQEGLITDVTILSDASSLARVPAEPELPPTEAAAETTPENQPPQEALVPDEPSDGRPG